MKKNVVKIVLGMVVSALALTLIAGAAFAQGPQTASLQRNGYGMGAMARFGKMGGAAWGHDATFEAVTELTGLTEEEIIAERQAGKSLAQIAASEGVSEQSLVDAILAAKKAVVDGLVADGKITQEQADLMLARMAEQVKVSVNRTEVGPRSGTRGAGRGNGGMGMGACGLGLSVAR